MSLPVFWAPVGYGCLGATIQVAAAASFFHRSNRFLLRSDLLRAVVAVIATTSFQPHELLGNAMSMQSHLYAPALILVAHIGHRSETMGARRALVYGAALFILGLTHPLLIVATPIVLWLLVSARNRAEVFVLTAFLSAVALQTFCFSKTVPTTPAILPTESRLAFEGRFAFATLSSFVFRVVLTPTLGLKASSAAAEFATIPVFLVALTAFGAILLRLCARVDRAQSARLLLALGCVLLSIAVPLRFRDLLAYFPDSRTFHFFDAPRYFLMGVQVFVWIMGLAMERFFPRLTDPVRAMMLTTCFALGMLSNFRDEIYPDSGWRSRSVEVAAWIQRFRAGDHPSRLVVPHPPGTWAFALE